MIDRVQFWNNFVGYSVHEEGFSFIQGGETSSEPERMSRGKQFIFGAVAGYALGIAGGMSSGYMKGSEDNEALVSDLRQMLELSDWAGVRLRDGMVILRLGIGADDLSYDTLIGRFAVIHERTVGFRKYAYTLLRTWIKETKLPTIAQGVVAFSDSQRATDFIQHYSDKCKHSNFWKGVHTQPWVVDMQREVVKRCAGFREHASTLPLDSKKAVAALFETPRIGSG